MKTRAILGVVLVCGLARGWAGETPVAPPAPLGMDDLPPVCDCFDLGGSAVDLYGVYVAPDSGGFLDDGFGGGVGFTHFSNSYLGFSTGVFWWDDGTDTVTSVTGSVIFRYPVRALCVAPYLIGGFGGHFDSYNQFTWHVGGGFEIRVPSLDEVGFFVEGTFNKADDTEDYGVFRVGTRFNF